MNSSVVCEKKGFKVRGKASTPSKISTQKGKRSDLMGSKQANENQQQQQREQGRLHRNGKRRARSIFLCDVEEEGFKEAKESTKRGKNGERVIRIPETARGEASNRNNASEPERNSPPSSGRFISQRATKSEPRGSAMILGPALTFYPEKSLRNKGKLHLRGFSLKGNERENWGENSGRETSLDEEKRE